MTIPASQHQRVSVDSLSSYYFPYDQNINCILTFSPVICKRETKLTQDLFQFVNLIQVFPWQVNVGPTEVTVRSSLLVDWPL